MNKTKPIIESRSFIFAGVRVASGLFWNTLTDIHSAVSESPTLVGSSVLFPAGKTTKMLAKQFNADLFTWRQTSKGKPVVQVGLSQSSHMEGDTKKVYSFASIIFNALFIHQGEHSLSACVVVESPSQKGLFFLAIQRDGKIIASADTFGDQKTIAQKVNDYTSSKDFIVYAPKSLELLEFNELPDPIALIHALSEKQLKSHLLLSPNITINTIIFIVLVISAIALLATFITQQYYDKLAIEKERQAAEDRSRLLARQQAELDLIEPVIQIYSPNKFLESCTQAFNTQDLYPGGWKFKSAICTKGLLTSHFNRNNSRVDYLMDTYSDAIVSSNGNAASVSYHFNFEPIEVEQKDLLSSQEAVNLLHTYNQSIGGGLKLNANMNTQSLPGRLSKLGESKQSPKEINWSFSPSIITNLSEFDIVGSSVREIEFTITADMLSLTLKGKTYANY